jgi:general nucleoside transport system ATP-binding protein
VTNDRGTGASSDAGARSASPAIELRDIVKRFPGVVANDGVNLTVGPGTIHALIGENGAGKSTVMKILYGAQRPDEGQIVVNGTETHFRSPKDAIAAGIGMVFQHFMLADNLTVWENIILGSEPTKDSVRLDDAKARERIAQLARDNGLEIDPSAYVSDLGVGERQRVEILKVLFRGARIIILDEPTAVLVPQEVDELFESLRELSAQGVTIVFISHKLDEVLAIADDITVIRAGRTVAMVKPADVTAKQLAELMVGSELPSPETRTSTVTDVVALELVDVTLAGHAPANAQGAEAAAAERKLDLDHVSLAVHRGEIVGIAGVEGNGQSDLLEVLIGTRRPTSGTITMEGHDLVATPTRDRRDHGLAYIPEDRHRDGLLLPSPLWENVMLGYQHRPQYSHRGMVDREAARRHAAEVIERFDVRTPGVDTMAVALSGGNQQKLIVGREMLSDPKVLVAAHPTRGIDVGAQAAVWDSLRDARQAGLAVLLISADLEELIGLSDTLLVMLRGRIVARLDPTKVTKSELGEYMTGARSAEVRA